jgi:hypothetical protein
MKFQNKIFYKFIFPQEFPYALGGLLGSLVEGKLAQRYQPKNPMSYS